MDLEELRENWDQLGASDPLWAILSVPEYQGNRWDVDAFFQSGEEAVADLLDRFAGDLSLPAATGRALDFGCGVGRLTQALGKRFDEVHGIDIAPSMIELAQRYNRLEARCFYHLNQRGDLRLFTDSSFDFVLSEIVLQHMEPDYALGYVREFVRLLKPGGLAVFQIPYASAHPAPPPGPWDRTSGPRIDMFALPYADVASAVEEAGGSIVRREETEIGGPAWRSYRYAVSAAQPGARP